MIIDAHCHAWHHWPYLPAVPDPLSRARVERLLWEMDQAGVERAVLISAAIDGNPDNYAYTRSCASAVSERLVAFPDVDCRWHATHQTPGAAQRLRSVLRQFDPVGFTHYLDEAADPAWLLSPDGMAFFAVADEARVIVSLACGACQLPTVGALAQRFARTPFLVHHLGRVTARPSDTEGLRALLQLASIPNVYIKLSGFGFAQEDGWDFPCTSALELVRAIYANFDVDRLCWGSDYPVSQRYMTYRQSLETVRTHCSFISGNDMQKVLGGNMKALLERGR